MRWLCHCVLISSGRAPAGWTASYHIALWLFQGRRRPPDSVSGKCCEVPGSDSLRQRFHLIAGPESTVSHLDACCYSWLGWRI